MIRLLTISDLSALSRLAPQFWAEGKLPGRFDQEVFTRTWTNLMNSGTGHVLGLFDTTGLVGALGFLVFPDANDGVLVGTEMFWFVEPNRRGDGLRLLREFEDVAPRVGAKRLMVAHLAEINGPELKRVYERKGYREVETFFIKEVS